MKPLSREIIIGRTVAANVGRNFGPTLRARSSVRGEAYKQQEEWLFIYLLFGPVSSRVE